MATKIPLFKPPEINITYSKDQKSKNSSNSSNIIKQGILEICHLVHKEKNENKIKELVGEQVLVTIYRTFNDYFVVINLLEISTNEFNHQNFNNSDSICINLKNCRVEKCSNKNFFKLILNDYTAVILFKIVKEEEKSHFLNVPQTESNSINNFQSKSLGDLSIIDQQTDNQNDFLTEEQTISWVDAFSDYNISSKTFIDNFVLRTNNNIPLSRRQSLQTVIESDEEEEFH